MWWRRTASPSPSAPAGRIHLPDVYKRQVLFNAVIIGIEIAVMFPDPTSSAPIWLACITNGISVGIGELISCTVLGVLLVKIIESSKALRKIFAA